LSDFKERAEKAMANIGDKAKSYNGIFRDLMTVIVFGFLTAVLIWVGKSNPDFIAGTYLPYSRAAENILSKITGFFSFSAAEILIYIVALGLAVSVIRLIFRLIAGPRRIYGLIKFVTGWAVAAAVLIFSFYVLWGLNYYAPPLSQSLGLNVKNRSSQELYELCTYLADNADKLAAQVERDSDGKIPDINFTKTADRVAKDFSAVTGRKETPAKYILASKPFSYTQITGVFTFITGESNVNSNSTSAALPFTMAHEMSHRYGIAPEDEANFFAFYVTRDSGDPLVKYSSYMMALTYSQNKLFSSSKTLYRKLYGTYGDLLIADLDQYARHWDQYEGKVAEKATTVNNTYLQAQGQEDGVKSYGRMVDLLLAWYETAKD